MTIISKSSTGVTDPFWPANRRRLELTFEVLADARIKALGRDPDNHNALAFRADLRPAQRDAFIQAVHDGVPGTPLSSPPSNENIPDAGTVVITGPGSGDGTGPRFLVILSP